jgi:hypothetical protein
MFPIFQIQHTTQFVRRKMEVQGSITLIRSRTEKKKQGIEISLDFMCRLSSTFQMLHIVSV